MIGNYEMDDGTPVCDNCGDEGTGAKPGQVCGREILEMVDQFEKAVICTGRYQQRAPQQRPIPRQVGLCIGCDQYEPLKEYEITLDDGSTQRVDYCVDCAEAAATPQAPQILACKAVKRCLT